MSLATPLVADQQVLDTVLSAGFQMDGGWLYPPGDPSRALVRISIFDHQYELWRRRRLSQPWMLINKFSAQDFDAAVFASWQASWPLSA